MEDLLSVLHPCCPVKVDALRSNRRRVEHGLTTVGLKIHSLSKDSRELSDLVEALGGANEALGRRFYAHALGTMTLVLPAVGNARSALLLLECIEHYTREPLFGNPKVQVQVCSPGRLEPPHAAILAIAFYLGSDILRRYNLDDLTTTFSEDRLPESNKHRGRRIVLYDGEGPLDQHFDWWNLEGSSLSITSHLPFFKERTDVLSCRSRVDIENVNLVATLLSHYENLGYWEHLGRKFIEDVEALLDRHLLSGILAAPWIHPADGKKADDQEFYTALQELMQYAFSEYMRLERERVKWWKKRGFQTSGILAEMRMLLWEYRTELLAESARLAQEELS